MSELTLQERLKLIEESTSMADLPVEALPASHKENYYFVSYSHKDYKMVFRDILRFEEMGIHIWYDSEMHMGENWREIAQMYISKFQCKGVIFYLTENSISSPACNEEVEYVLTHNKTFFSINQALDGAPVESGHSMLKRMMARGFLGSDALLESFSKAFPDQILFLPYDANIDTKAKQILSIKGEELLCVESAFTYFGEEKRAKVVKCRDSSILTVDLSKQYDVSGEGDYRFISEVDDCAFTNCFKLQSVKMPETLKTVRAHAFRNCASLTDIDLSFVEKVEDNAFDGCTSLRLDRLSVVEVGRFAFRDVPFTSVCYDAPKPCLHDFAFAFNDSIEEFHITSPFYRDIGQSVFDGCRKLKKVGPFITAPLSERNSDALIKIGVGCFTNCDSLEEIHFKGDWDFSEAGALVAWSKRLRLIDADIAGTVIPVRFAIHCEGLEEITNSSRFTVIEEGAFEECKALKAFDLSSATMVGEKAFYETGISEANLVSARSIGKEAFACSAIERLTVGESCTEIADGAFAYCHNLRVVKILSRHLKQPAWLERMFASNGIHVLYLKCDIYDKILSECVFEKLRLVYISEEVYRGGFERENFAEAESDVLGYRKFYNTEVAIDYVADEDVDWQSDEVNKEDPSLLKFSMEEPEDLVGHEIAIKHARAHNPRQYFVEKVVTLPEQRDTVDYVMVSLHRGKSFRLDGTMIESVAFSQQDVLKFNTWGGLSVNGLPEDLSGKMLRLEANGELYMGICERVEIVPPLYYNHQFDAMAAEDRKIIQAIVLLEDGTLRAISGRDIKSFAVFNDEFEVTHHFTRDLFFNPFR
ncbi:MAG: leucine-rich repeat protein [Clostridia bacterium]|nr:leucine-rich repeat protein [Clostridia bacterium]